MYKLKNGNVSSVGEGIFQAEDVDFFDERPNLIRTGFGGGMIIEII